MFFKNSLDFQTRDWVRYRFISMTMGHWGEDTISRSRGGFVYSRHRSDTALSGDGSRYQSVATRTGPTISPF